MKRIKRAIGLAVCATVCFGSVSVSLAGMMDSIKEAVHEMAEESRAQNEIEGLEEDRAWALKNLPFGAENVKFLGQGWVQFSLSDKDFLFYKESVYRGGYAALTQVK